MYRDGFRSSIQFDDLNIDSTWIFEDSIGKAVEFSLDFRDSGTVFLSLDELKLLVAELEAFEPAP